MIIYNCHKMWKVVVSTTILCDFACHGIESCSSYITCANNRVSPFEQATVTGWWQLIHLRCTRKNLQEKGKSHLVLSPFKYRTAVIFQALIPTMNAFQSSCGINLQIWNGESVFQTMQLQLSHQWGDAFFSFHACWSISSSLFAVSESPSNNDDKKISSLEAVRGFKVKGRFPSKSAQRNSISKSVQKNSTRDFWKVWWRPALLWLVRSRFDGSRFPS